MGKKSEGNCIICRNGNTKVKGLPFTIGEIIEESYYLGNYGISSIIPVSAVNGIVRFYEVAKKFLLGETTYIVVSERKIL